MTSHIYLASRSPRRRELLDQIGIHYELVDVDIDESWNGEELPADYVCRIAKEKARAGKAQVDDNMPLLAADTAVVLDNIILGKAETLDTARDMLKRLSGKSHTVLSAVTLINDQERTLLSESRVTFKQLSEEEIDWYCETREPLGKAGGYAIQGNAGAFIERLEGSYSGVMGLPLYETSQLLDSPATLRKQ